MDHALGRLLATTTPSRVLDVRMVSSVASPCLLPLCCGAELFPFTLHCLLGFGLESREEPWQANIPGPKELRTALNGPKGTQG